MTRLGTGYTLLEMVVVMTLLAIATAVAAPPSYRMINTWREASEVEDVIEQIERLPTLVRARGNSLLLGDDEKQDEAELPIRLPQDWVLEMQSPLRIQANGACSDAKAVLITTRQAVPIEISAPFCGVKRLQP